MKLNQTLTFNFHLFQPILEGTVDQGSKWPSILVRIHTYIQSLNIPLCAISRQVFGREKCFQYSIRMFLLCSKRRVVKLCKYHDTSGSNFKALWATYLTALKHQNSLNYHHHPATLSSAHLLFIFSLDILKKHSSPFYHQSPCCKS